jgi:hypothetical protein
MCTPKWFISLQQRSLCSEGCDIQHKERLGLVAGKTSIVPQSQNLLSTEKDKLAFEKL